MSRPNDPDRFDAEYYRRHYGSRRTRVHGAREIAQLARGITGLIGWWGAPIERVLDVGAGAGLWRDWFARHHPVERYRSIELSAYACETYGHEQRDITKWRGREKYDLVICHGVLPYIDDAGAAAAIENIAAMSKGFLYLEAITKRDLGTVCDPDLTDTHVFPRTGKWYRQRLDAHFAQLGCGLFYKHDGERLFYELETPR